MFPLVKRKKILYTVRMRRCILILIAFCMLGFPACARDPYDAKTLDVYVWDIGQADSILLQYDGYNVLIDAGEQDDGEDIVQALAAHGVEKLDLFIVTHYDKDHIGGADAVLSSFPIDRMLAPDYTVDTKQYRQMQTAMRTTGITAEYLREDTAFSIGDATYTVWVSTVPYEDNDNEQSLVVKVNYDGVKLLFAGDAEERWLRSLTLSGRELGCDVLKLPHHGVFDANLSVFFAVTLPTHVIVTDSEKNPMETETQEVLDYFETDYRCTKDGDIHLTVHAGTVTFS